jgi:hypothetical protein
MTSAPQPTRPDLMPVFRDSCTCAPDGRRNTHCRIHRATDEDDA